MCVDLEVGPFNSYMERPESATIKYRSLFQAPGLSTGASPCTFKILDSSKAYFCFGSLCWLFVPIAQWLERPLREPVDRRFAPRPYHYKGDKIVLVSPLLTLALKGSAK